MMYGFFVAMMTVVAIAIWTAFLEYQTEEKIGFWKWLIKLIKNKP